MIFYKSRSYNYTDKQMKKILVTLLLVITAISASAEFRWGPTVGLNVSTYHWKQKLVDTKLMPGFQAGVMGEIMIPGIGFGIDVGLRYQMHGAKVNFGEYKIWSVDDIGNEKLTLHTLQIPLNLRFKWTRMNGLESTIAPFAYAGPLFSFNLAQADVPCVEHPLGSVGLQCGAGAELFEHYQVSIGYMWGVSYDVRTLKLDNFSGQSRGLQVNLAWLF